MSQRSNECCDCFCHSESFAGDISQHKCCTKEDSEHLSQLAKLKAENDYNYNLKMMLQKDIESLRVEKDEKIEGLLFELNDRESLLDEIARALNVARDYIGDEGFISERINPTLNEYNSWKEGRK